MFYTPRIYKQLNTLRGVLMKSPLSKNPIEEVQSSLVMVHIEAEYNKPRALLGNLRSISTSH